MKGPRLLEATIQIVLADMSRGADSISKSSQASRAAPQTGRRCGSRGSIKPTGTSPAPSARDEVTGDRKTNGSAPRPSRREAEPQRRFPAWFAALSRRMGVSRDQPQDRGASSDVNRHRHGAPQGGGGVTTWTNQFLLRNWLVKPVRRLIQERIVGFQDRGETPKP